MYSYLRLKKRQIFETCYFNIKPVWLISIKPFFSIFWRHEFLSSVDSSFRETPVDNFFLRSRFRYVPKNERLSMFRRMKTASVLDYCKKIANVAPRWLARLPHKFEAVGSILVYYGLGALVEYKA